jgi:hypothetical protein
MNVALTDLLFSKVNVSNLVIEDVSINMNRIQTDSLFNFNFLITAFSGTEKQEEVTERVKIKMEI